MWYIYVYIYTSVYGLLMFMYALGVWDYLRGPVKTQNRIMTEWLSAFFSEALEPQKVKRPCNRGVTKMKFLFFCTRLSFRFSFCFKLREAERVGVSSPVVSAFFFFFCICTVSALFVRLWNLTLETGKIGGTAWFSLSSASLSCHPIPLPTPQPSPGWKQVWLFLYWAVWSSTTVEQCSVVGSVCTGFSSWHWRAPLRPTSPCLRHKKSS